MIIINSYKNIWRTAPCTLYPPTIPTVFYSWLKGLTESSRYLVRELVAYVLFQADKLVAPIFPYDQFLGIY